MSIVQFLKREARELLGIALFFFVGFALVLGLFKLVLEDYAIPFDVLAKALLGALILAKVVLVLRSRAFMQYFPRHPGIVRILYRTLIYLPGVAVVIALEKVIDAYGEAGGFMAAVEHVLSTRSAHHVLAVTFIAATLLLAFNFWEELRQEVGGEKLSEALFRRRNRPE